MTPILIVPDTIVKILSLIEQTHLDIQSDTRGVIQLLRIQNRSIPLSLIDLNRDLISLGYQIESARELLNMAIHGRDVDAFSQSLEEIQVLSERNLDTLSRLSKHTP